MESMCPTLSSYIRDISKIPTLNNEENTKHATAYRNGDKSIKDKMIEGNLKLVIYIAKQFTNTTASLIDMINEGNIGLIKAVDKYDPELGYFTTYASFLIRQTIIRFLQSNLTSVKIPIRKNILIAKAKKELETHTKKEVAYLLGISIKELHNLLAISTYVVALDKISEIYRDGYNYTDSTLHNYTYKEGNSFILRNILDIEQNEMVNQAIDYLKPKHQQALRLRFGIGCKALKLNEIGKIASITNEAVRIRILRASQELKTIISTHNKFEELSQYAR